MAQTKVSLSRDPEAPTNGVQLVWKIENFSCPKDAIISSPIFSSPSSEWKITVVDTNSNILLKLHSLKNYKKCFHYFKCSLEMLDSHRIPMIWKEGKSTNGSVTFLFSNLTQFIDSNNSLIIQCRIWPTLLEGNRYLPIFAKTRIIVALEKRLIAESSFVGSFEHHSFQVPVFDGHFIKIVRFIDKKGKLCVQLKTALLGIFACITVNVLHKVTKRKTKLKFFSKKLEKELEIFDFDATLMIGEVKLKGLSNLLLELSCRFLAEIVVTHRIVNETECFPSRQKTDPKETPCSYETKNNRSSKSKKNCNYDLKNSSSESEKNCSNYPKNNHSAKSKTYCSYDLTNNSSKSEKNCSKDTQTDLSTLKSSVPTELHLPNVSQILHNMFKEGYMSDFKLRVGECVFPVHKSILGMRSQVFREMFETQENCVADIQDVEADTLLTMLRFIYSDSLGMDMSWVRSSSLYAAADKFALESLKQSCSALIQSGISTSNILEVLSMANAHQDEDLMSAALEFLYKNDEDIVNSEVWGKFEEDNPKLAVQTFRKLYMKKK